jgi:hypothetical protein
MSKKKGKPAARKAPNKRGQTARKPAAKSRVAAKSRGLRLTLTRGESSGRTVYATIYIFRTSNGNRIRTAPQTICANPGDRIEWTVVNMVDGSDVPVTITWPNAGPWGKEPIEFRSSDRKALGAGASGRFKYVVSALDAQEDPEIDIPDI